jgi:PKD domain-containing protein
MRRTLALKLCACMSLLGGTLISTNNASVKPPPASCPVITIFCVSKEPCRGPNYTFTANVSGGYADREPTYKWSVSAGTIASGQGTSAIEVNDGGTTDKPLTVSVEVGNIIPEGCPTTESNTVQRAKSTNPSAKTRPCEETRPHSRPTRARRRAASARPRCRGSRAG